MRALIIDTETTGLSHNYNQILTLGMLLAEFNEEGIFPIDSRHIRIRHERYNVNPMALKINKINLTEHHKIAIDAEEAISEINDFILLNKIGDIPMIGHNISFDIRFLREFYRQNEKEYVLDYEVIDTRQLWIQLKEKGVIPMHLKGNLRCVSEHLCVDYDNAHDALGDCLITANVFHKMLLMIKSL